MSDTEEEEWKASSRTYNVPSKVSVMRDAITYIRIVTCVMAIMMYKARPQMYSRQHPSGRQAGWQALLAFEPCHYSSHQVNNTHI